MADDPIVCDRIILGYSPELDDDTTNIPASLTIVYDTRDETPWRRGSDNRPYPYPFFLGPDSESARPGFFPTLNEEYAETILFERREAEPNGGFVVIARLRLTGDESRSPSRYVVITRPNKASLPGEYTPSPYNGWVGRPQNWRELSAEDAATIGETIRAQGLSDKGYGAANHLLYKKVTETVASLPDMVNVISSRADQAAIGRAWKPRQTWLAVLARKERQACARPLADVARAARCTETGWRGSPPDFALAAVLKEQRIDLPAELARAGPSRLITRWLCELWKRPIEQPQTVDWAAAARTCYEQRIKRRPTPGRLADRREAV